VRLKRKGKIVFPFLILLDGLKFFVGKPFKKMEKKR